MDAPEIGPRHLCNMFDNYRLGLGEGLKRGQSKFPMLELCRFVPARYHVLSQPG